MTDWIYQVDISPWWKNPSLTFEQERNAIVSAIKGSKWYRELGGDHSELHDVLEDLSAAVTISEFDAAWDQLCDLADWDRAWINLWGRASLSFSDDAS